VSWTRVAERDDLWSGETRRVIAAGTPVLLVRLGEDVVAYADVCPHQGVALSEGTLDGATLVCRAHRWEFDLRSGEATNPRGICLRRFPARIEGGAILVDPSDARERPRRGPSPVGPVLRAGATADALVAAIRELNDGVAVLDRGSYRRVTVPGRCRLTREAIERHIGRSFRLPADLEIVMPSFEGRLTIDEGSATWSDGR
jgi:nitrite reductase/ring-hydroxylating ferredoxin subunit